MNSQPGNQHFIDNRRKKKSVRNCRKFTGIFFLQLGQSRSLVPWGCLPSRSSAITQEMHAWDLLLKFYDMKVRKKYTYIGFLAFIEIRPNKKICVVQVTP